MSFRGLPCRNCGTLSLYDLYVAPNLKLSNRYFWRLSGRKLSIMVVNRCDRVSLEDRGRWQYLKSLFCASIPLFVSTAP